MEQLASPPPPLSAFFFPPSQSSAADSSRSTPSPSREFLVIMNRLSHKAKRRACGSRRGRNSKVRRRSLGWWVVEGL